MPSAAQTSHAHRSRKAVIPSQSKLPVRRRKGARDLLFHCKTAPNCLITSLSYYFSVLPKSRGRIFLVSPANASGVRANLILRPGAGFPLAVRLQQGKLTLGEAFSFISGLYFRGKLAYAKAFAQPPANIPGVLVITACGGLVAPETLVTGEALRRISSAASEARYRIPLERDARLLAQRIGGRCQVILLGSIATPRYVEPLSQFFGEQLLFPASFAGRGNMSRGGLMLRCVRSGAQLDYVSVATANRHGSRPPKLAPISPQIGK